jgi:hypothetical protein
MAHFVLNTRIHWCCVEETRINLIVGSPLIVRPTLQSVLISHVTLPERWRALLTPLAG